MMIPILAEALDVSTHTITNSIFGIRDYYTVKDLTSRAILDGAIKEKNEFPDADCIAGAFIGKSESPCVYSSLIVLMNSRSSSQSFCNIVIATV